MKNSRTLNGYVLVYKPEHPKAMTSENWKGYVYEHIVIVEEDYGKSLSDNEQVHHLDLNRSNNRPSNLIILSKKSHGKLHKWIDAGCLIEKEITANGCKRCLVCKKPLKLKQRYYCSENCMLSNKKSKLDGIPLQEVLNNLTEKSFITVSKQYNLSDNGLRKILKIKYGLDKANLKIALDSLKNQLVTGSYPVESTIFNSIELAGLYYEPEPLGVLVSLTHSMNILIVYTCDPTGMSQDETDVIHFQDGHKFNPYDTWHDIIWNYLKLKDYEYLHVWTVKFLG